jgi:hypothetical protein
MEKNNSYFNISIAKCTGITSLGLMILTASLFLTCLTLLALSSSETIRSSNKALKNIYNKPLPLYIVMGICVIILLTAMCNYSSISSLFQKKPSEAPSETLEQIPGQSKNGGFIQ